MAFKDDPRREQIVADYNLLKQGGIYSLGEIGRILRTWYRDRPELKDVMEAVIAERETREETAAEHFRRSGERK